MCICGGLCMSMAFIHHQQQSSPILLLPLSHLPHLVVIVCVTDTTGLSGMYVGHCISVCACMNVCTSNCTCRSLCVKYVCKDGSLCSLSLSMFSPHFKARRRYTTPSQRGGREECSEERKSFVVQKRRFSFFLSVFTPSINHT